MPRLRLYIVLALGTGARNAALLELTWARCDFARGIIDLRNPEITRPHKGRAIVPMNRAVRAALMETQAGALSDYVIEWAGKPVASDRDLGMGMFVFEIFGRLDRDGLVIAVRAWRPVNGDLIAGASHPPSRRSSHYHCASMAASRRGK